MDTLKTFLFYLLFTFILLGTSGCGDAFQSDNPGASEELSMQGLEFVGDMRVESDSIQTDDSSDVTSSGASMRLGTLGREKWPVNNNGVIKIRYHFHPSFSANLRSLAKDAMARWQADLPLVFVKQEYQSIMPTQILEFRADQSGCWADFGRRKYSPSIVNIGQRSTSCHRVGVIMHELGHTLGLIHEHQRVGRGEFVRVLKDNVKPGSLDNFKVISDSINRTGYDFHSIMHYSTHNHSVNGKKTLTTRPEYAEFESILGDAVLIHGQLSEGDVETIKMFYKVE